MMVIFREHEINSHIGSGYNLWRDDNVTRDGEGLYRLYTDDHNNMMIIVVVAMMMLLNVITTFEALSCGRRRRVNFLLHWQILQSLGQF